MTEPSKIPNPLDMLVEQIRAAVREEIKAARSYDALITPEDLAKNLGVPLSWIYEQSRLGNIPTHRLGKYIRFDLNEVIESQREKAP